ncbi:MAG: phytanoyl-CoA dioxygenase family protein [Snowella sp.]|nr:phytanoyl-CoA dioxygenase family protein [Snowella sp.]
MQNNSYLPTANSETESIDEVWSGTNEQWWNWYLSLADNSPELVNKDKLIPYPEPVISQIPSFEELQQELAEPYPIATDQIQKFQADSFIRIKNFFSPAALYLLRQELIQLFHQKNPSIPNQEFSNMEMMWLESQVVKEFVFSRRLGELAANLLQISSVRVYHDDFLCKEPGGGRTPWHYDGYHYPIASDRVGTFWIPLQETPIEMGPLQLAVGTENYKLVKNIPFDKFAQGHDQEVAKVLKANKVSVNCEPFSIGEISFQCSLNVHGASANHTTARRIAFGISYFENGACVTSLPTLVSGDWQKFMPDIEPSQPIVSSYTPIVYNSEIN